MVGCGNTGRDSEVGTQLEVWSNDAIKRQLSGNCRNEAVYRKIEAERGVVREWKQCRNKLKALKKYKKVVDGLRCSGVGVKSDDNTIETDWPPTAFFPPG